MSASRIVAAGLVAVALVAAVLAHDLRAVRDAVRADDAHYRARSGRPDWRSSAWLPVERLVGARADLEQRRALVLARRALAPASAFGGQERLGEQARAERALAAIVQGADAAKASQAADLLGVLAFSGTRGAQRGLAAFQQAYRADPRNEVAKYNLELALRILQPRGSREGSSPGAGPRGDRGRGAGSGRPGRGY
jgi:hypothetical protein